MLASKGIARKGELHFPTVREEGNGPGLANIGEASRGERLDDLLTNCLDKLVVDDEIKDEGVHLRTINLVLDFEAANLVRRQGAPECGLTGARTGRW